MREIGAFEVKNKLGQLLDRLEAGEEVIVTRREPSPNWCLPMPLPIANGLHWFYLNKTGMIAHLYRHSSLVALI
jgi:hypothetical protein